MTERVITLQKPPKDLAGYDRGERMIMVDGVQWGRTHVTHRGRNGYIVTFQQTNGGIISRPEDPDETKTGKGMHYRDRSEEVWNVGSRSHRFRRDDAPPGETTEERVLAKIKLMIESGQLLDPVEKKRQNEEWSRNYRARMDAAAVEKNAAFEAEARKALRINNDEPSELVDRVVEAMKWAQSQ